MLAKIRKSALDLLARREHSKFELQRKLSGKGFAVDDIASVVETLVKQGLQSNARFVEGYVNMRQQRGFGPVRIKLELRDRGIDQESTVAVVHENDRLWFALANEARRKKFGEKIPDGLRERAQQMRYLYYKGFTSDQISMIFKL